MWCAPAFNLWLAPALRAIPSNQTRHPPPVFVLAGHPGDRSCYAVRVEVKPLLATMRVPCVGDIGSRLRRETLKWPGHWQARNRANRGRFRCLSDWCANEQTVEAAQMASHPSRNARYAEGAGRGADGTRLLGSMNLGFCRTCNIGGASIISRPTRGRATGRIGRLGSSPIAL
jgi:hypothetical protein